MTGNLTVHGLNATTKITGGTGDDTISTVAASAVLDGGAGDDRLELTSSNTLSTLTGGEGNDTFVISGNVNSSTYSTIMDFSEGDSIDMGATTFNSTAVELAVNATFEQYLDATAANNVGGWFQFGGDTFVVDGVGGGATYDDNINAVVAIDGLVDFSTVALNGTEVFIA